MPSPQTLSETLSLGGLSLSLSVLPWENFLREFGSFKHLSWREGLVQFISEDYAIYPPGIQMGELQVFLTLSIHLLELYS